MVHVLLKPGSENFEHYFTSVLDECNCPFRPRKGVLKKRGFQTPGNTLTGESIASLGTRGQHNREEK